MTSNSELHAALQRLERATSKLSIDDAINLIDREISDTQNADYKPHFQVHKATLLWTAGQMLEAIELLEQCAIEYDSVDSPQYFAGEHLLELGHFDKAMQYLNRCVEISESSSDGWYKDSAYLLRAYCAAKLGRFAQARQDLEKIDDDEPMSWLAVDPIVSRSSIVRMVEARR
jgi:tetratricopeptide (TPR) repeat protein